MRAGFFGLMLCLIPILSAVGFLAVGHYVNRDDVHGFDWELASIFGTALGTLLLALATGALALTTARDVSATRQIAELTRLDRVDRFTPKVIARDNDVGEDTLSVELVNIGPGPAVKLVVSCESDCATVGIETLASLLPGETDHVHIDCKWTAAARPRGITWEPMAPRYLPDNYTVTGHFLDWRGVRAGDILDWIQADPTTS